MGLNDAALSIIDESLKYPEVCLKYYNELMSARRWQDAVELLDKAQRLKKEKVNGWLGTVGPDWLAMKQNLLMEHGTKEMQIPLRMNTMEENKEYQDKQLSKGLMKHDAVDDRQLLSINIESLIYIIRENR